MKRIFISALVVTLVLSIFTYTRANAVALSISNNLPGMTAGMTDPGAWINGFYKMALMLGGVLAAGLVAAADMAAGSADPQMKPFPAQRQTFLAAFAAGRDLLNGVQMGAEILAHWAASAIALRCRAR